MNASLEERQREMRLRMKAVDANIRIVPLAERKPVSLTDGAAPTYTDSDGYLYYFCVECGDDKLAALFLPAELAKPSPVCRACSGEIRRNFRQAGMGRPTTYGQRVAFHSPQPRTTSMPTRLGVGGSIPA